MQISQKLNLMQIKFNINSIQKHNLQSYYLLCSFLRFLLIYQRIENRMDRFQHMMRTTQHTKSVEMIMTRTNHHFTKSKQPHKKPPAQGDNITTYLRKVEIDRQNLNLAKRIMQCESQHSRQRYTKQWQKVKRFLQVRSNFKKTLHAQQPKIYKFQPILGKGRLKLDIKFKQIHVPWTISLKQNFYKFTYLLGTNQIQPDNKLITMQFVKNYQTTFYAPSFLKKKKITCKILQVNQNNCYQLARFHIDLTNRNDQLCDIHNRFGKTIGNITVLLSLQSGRKKHTKKLQEDKENQSIDNHSYLFEKSQF